MKFKKFGKLPGKPSELLALAMKDLAKVERSKKYIVKMGVWHAPLWDENKSVCAVCLAGSVMAKTLNVPITTYTDPAGKEERALEALDYFRCGEVQAGISTMYENSHTNYRHLNRFVQSYHEDRVQFRADMRKLISDLRAAGL